MQRFRPAARFTSTCSAAVLLAAGVAWHETGVHRGTRLSWDRVSLGEVTFPTPTVRRFDDQESLDRYLVRATRRRGPRLDFSGHSYVLLTTGPRSSSRYGIGVVSVTEQRDRLLVRARETAPRLSDVVRPEVTSPYRLLRIPATDKPPVVEWQGR